MPLIDPFGRRLSYLRLSLTDRCNLRCRYCMVEEMDFLPRADVLTLEEIDRLAGLFIRLGTSRIRLTGGEPLVRAGAMELVRSLGRHVRSGALEELTLTTNGTMLYKHAAGLREAGVRRVNVSLDTLDPHKFRAITRWGKLDKVLGGIDAARDAGLVVKINMVALKGVNDDEVHRMVAWCGEQGFDLTFIELMPMGDTGFAPLDGPDPQDRFLPLARLRTELETRWNLEPSGHRTGGPARYMRVKETGGRIGFITPLTHGFCDGCTRVRLTCSGSLCLCLGQEDAVDLRTPLRRGDDDGQVMAVVRDAIRRKPKGHGFARPGGAVRRAISVTGG
ncbi:GTP 3',8-cyclase MoaA [Azospirillum picis]|nr:GTP 3',8-cyclase MoaA [Azospirillum picis]